MGYSSQSRFQYKNHFGFGQTCQQYHVDIEGHTEVSEQQREQIYSSWDSQKCQYYTEKEETLRQQMSSTNSQEYEEEYRQLEKEHTEAARQKQKYCSKKVEQSKSLDYTEFDVTYSSQLPRQVYTWAKRTNMGLKAALYQYISYIGEETNQNKITVKLNINQQLNSLTMTVASPEDTTRYRNIRLPYQLAGMIPLVAGKNPAEQGYKALTGESWMSQCVVGEGYVQTFDQSSKLFGKSYRTKSSQCSPLSQQTIEEIKREEQECAKYETKRTQVSSIFSSGQRDSYSIKKHSYIYKKGQLCISQEPVVQCSEDSIPKSMTKKTIKFVCLPEGPISKLYSDRIERGESPQELKHQPVAFTAQMDQPVICGPSQL